ncbi:MAG: site-specific DNA-methyltransferase [Thermodesulfobacteriota bacterium]|nr:site-specific DNA-methyltransferase [Thermodesulfobacteriota bacterium]
MDNIRKTQHLIRLTDSSDMSLIDSGSVQLVVTSPPYPMIEMWDHQFISKNQDIRELIGKGRGFDAFECMHSQLDRVWDEVYRILEPGCFACINIGDAARTINKDFRLFPNHAMILNHLVKTGFLPMPSILWRKQTNAPNKFMGSGMLPGGAYVTLEHEHILILRKGSKREFKTQAQKELRRKSAIFWEERNQWFSDIWFDLKGTTQKLISQKERKRSGAFPFALPYRLINMYSIQGDTVVDPFLGIGTTTMAAMAAARNSVGYELEKNVMNSIEERITPSGELLNTVVFKRLKSHQDFVCARKETGKELKHFNGVYQTEVVTNQEKNICFKKIDKISFKKRKKMFLVSHAIMDHKSSDEPQKQYKKPKPGTQQALFLN